MAVRITSVQMIPNPANVGQGYLVTASITSDGSATPTTWDGWASYTWEDMSAYTWDEAGGN